MVALINAYGKILLWNLHTKISSGSWVGEHGAHWTLDADREDEAWEDVGWEDEGWDDDAWKEAAADWEKAESDEIAGGWEERWEGWIVGGFQSASSSRRKCRILTEVVFKSFILLIYIYFLQQLVCLLTDWSGCPVWFSR